MMTIKLMLNELKQYIKNNNGTIKALDYKINGCKAYCVTINNKEYKNSVYTLYNKILIEA